MLHKDTRTLLELHLKSELSAFDLYLKIANEFCKLGWTETFKFYLKQAQEELEHAYRILEYVESQNDHLDYNFPVVSNLGLPSKNVELYLLELSLKQEENLSKSIHDFYHDISVAHDIRTLKFLDWFVEEQKEEEELFHDIIDTYNNLDFNRKIEFEKYIKKVGDH